MKQVQHGVLVGTTTFGIRLWHQQNFGEDLVLGFDGGKLYTWDVTNGTSTRGVCLCLVWQVHQESLPHITT